MSRIHNRSLEGVGLRAVEAHILFTLWQRGPMTVSEVQRALGIRGSTLTGALDRLEGRELLRRQAVPDDRRSIRLVAAPWSKRRTEELDAAVVDAEEQCFGQLSRAERAELRRLLTKANESLANTE